MIVSNIDWAFWSSLPQMKIWQAVALSLGIDPDKMNQSRDYWRHLPEDCDIPNARLRDEFNQRLRLLVDHRSDATHFTPGLSSVDTPANHRVDFKQVTQWLALIERSYPTAPARIANAGAISPSTPLPAPLTPKQKLLVWQEEQIWRATRSLGYDPLALPVDDRKRDFFVKSVIRARCALNHPVKMRVSIFEKAWERMMSSVPEGLKYAGP